MTGGPDETIEHKTFDRREQALNNYRKVVARLLPGTDAGLASKLFRSVKPGIRTRWE